MEKRNFSSPQQNNPWGQPQQMPPGYAYPSQYPQQPGYQQGYQFAQAQPQGQPGPQGYQQPSSTPSQQPSQEVYKKSFEVGSMTPAGTASALDHADKNYSKGARRGGFWRFLYFLAMIILIGSLCCVGYVFFTYWSGQHEYDELTEYMSVTDTDDYTTLADFKVDWDALRAINPDVVGWVYMPDTIINYPIVWKDHDDQYYLKRSFGDNSAGAFGAEYGCIMLAGVNSPEWTDQVNVIFGHHLNNGSMFATFGQFTDSTEFNAHRTVYVLTPEGNFKLTTFAVNKVLGSSTDIVIPNFVTDEDFTAYVEQRFADSLVTPVPPPPSVESIKQVFAFSTCSEPDNWYRIVTFATVDEFLPAGAERSKGDSLVDEDDLSEVHDQVAERVS